MAFTGNGSSAGNSSGTTLVIAYPPTMTAGNILTMLVYVEQTGLTLSMDKGTWTKDTAASGQQTASSTAFATHVFTCLIGSETGNLTISWGGANVWRTAWILEHSGRFASGTPQDCTSSYNATASASTTGTATAISPANTASDLVCWESNVDGSTHNTWTAGLTEQIDTGGLGVATEDNLASSGSTGSKTVSVISTFWTMGMMAIRVAGAAGKATKNYHPWTLGVNLGVGIGLPGGSVA